MAQPGPASAGSVEEVLALLRAGGGRVTSSRRILLEILFEGPGHLSAEELARAVQARAPDIHLTTIYRNLDELERLGVLVHTHLGHGPATYHLASAQHGHLVCQKCGATIEAPEELFEALSTAALSRFGFRVDARHFAVLGHCRQCRLD